MRVVLAGMLAVALQAAPQYRTLNDRFEPPRFTTLEAWNARASYLRQHILASAGLLPMPKRGPLNPSISGEIHHEDYTVSKVYFESLPGFLVTGNLYKPTGSGPFPAILSPHGHWPNGRLENTDIVSVPGRAISLARQGFVVFSYDMIGYGDSRQLTHTFGSRREALWGLSLGGLQVWNSIRSLDFLETLPYVRKDGFGATGESGGGTQTFLLAAVDTRVTVAAPINMISLHMQGGDLCENMPGLRLDTNNVEVAATIAPRPMLMVSATGDWTNETLEKEYPAIRSIYSLFGAAENVHAVRVEAPHNGNKESREAVYAWMARWLQHAPASVKRPEQPFTVDPIGDLLVFPPGGRLPEKAVTADNITDHWIKAAADRVAERRDISSPDPDPDLDAALRHALGFGDPAGLPSAAAKAPSARRIVINATLVAHPDDRAFKAAGLGVIHVAFTPPRAGEAQVRHFTTYNRTRASQQVADIVAALRATPRAVLVADGEAALPALLAAALVPVARTIVDVERFDLSNDRDFLNHLDIPGLRRAGDLQTAANMWQGEVIVHNAGDRFEIPRGKVVKRRLTAREIAADAAAPASRHAADR